MTARRGLLLAGVALALALVAGRLLAGAYADWAWYRAMDAESLWTARLLALTVLRGGLFAVAFVFTFANLFAMRRSIVSLVLPRQLGNLEIGEAVPARALTGAAVAISLLIAGALAIPEGDWVSVLRARWATPLGELDPYLQRDLAFWMGWLPLERAVHEWFVTLAVVVGVTLMLLYGLTPSVQVERGRVHISTWVRRHFAIYSALLLLLVAWGYRLDTFDLLIHGSGARETFVAFDHRVLYPYLIALTVATCCTALMVAWTGWMGYQRATIGGLLLVLVAGPIGRMVLPMLDRRAADERERGRLDRPYRNVRALYTRRAYGVDEVLRGAAADSLRVNAARLATSVSGWDPAALSRAIADEPGLPAVDRAISWRVTAAGQLRASVLVGNAAQDAARAPLARQESDPSDADDRGAPWPSPDIVATSVPALAVGFGLTPVLPVADTLGRVAAPTFPAGWQRIALAWSVRNLRLAASGADPRHTRLLLHRDVLERVRLLLPFFTAGGTPQAVVAGDSLWWAVELFNASADYPLTEPLQLNGLPIRTAVPAGIALVNAQSGRLRVVLPERPDGVTRWWRDHLPHLFTPRRAVDPALLAALPAPVDRAVLQGSALARVGFRNDTLDARPLFDADDADLDLLPGTAQPFVSGTGSLAWAVTAVDGVDRVRGAFVAVGGASPATALVEQPDTLRWATMLDRLQRAADSAGISRSRRHPRRGRVQVVPTTEGLYLFQSFYEWPPERAPGLRGVVALHAGTTQAGSSLLTALGAPSHPAGSDGAVRIRVAKLYAELRDAMRRGDWNAFGRTLDALGLVVGSRP
ncbi:MAG: UPF0182 family protein [Gemmatimonadaceae bacterium]